MLRESKRKPFLVDRPTWTLATLLGGIFTVAIYWLVHHSTLRSSTP